MGLFQPVILPAIVAACAIMLSVRLAVRDFGVAQSVLSLAVVLMSGWSVVVLIRITVGGAWPTYLPHLAIIAACLVVGIQSWLIRR